MISSSLRRLIFLAKLYGLELWGADIGNTYLESKTHEHGNDSVTTAPDSQKDDAFLDAVDHDNSHYHSQDHPPTHITIDDLH